MTLESLSNIKNPPVSLQRNAAVMEFVITGLLYTRLSWINLTRKTHRTPALNCNFGIHRESRFSNR
jgi:hypothetical protein